MIQELSAADLEGRARVFISVQTRDLQGTAALLHKKYADVRGEGGELHVYGEEDAESIVRYLLENGQAVCGVKKNKIGLEEYYVELMSRKEA